MTTTPASLLAEHPLWLAARAAVRHEVGRRWLQGVAPCELLVVVADCTGVGAAYLEQRYADQVLHSDPDGPMIAVLEGDQRHGFFDDAEACARLVECLHRYELPLMLIDADGKPRVGSAEVRVNREGLH